MFSTLEFFFDYNFIFIAFRMLESTSVQNFTFIVEGFGVEFFIFLLVYILRILLVLRIFILVNAPYLEFILIDFDFL